MLHLRQMTAAGAMWRGAGIRLRNVQQDARVLVRALSSHAPAVERLPNDEEHHRYVTRVPEWTEVRLLLAFSFPPVEKLLFFFFSRLCFVDLVRCFCVLLGDGAV